jgi:hypothetical protein
MLMKLLFEGRFDDYLRDAAVGDGALVFVHVPKTAGSSLRAELAARLQPDINIEVDYTDTTRLFRDKMDDAVRDFLAGPAERIRFASGHLMGRHVAQMRTAMRNARFVTFLRDPVDRVVSDYRYQRSPKHPPHPQFREKYPTLEAYLEFKGDRNKAAQHLIAPPVYAGRDPEECVAYMLRTYDFVGVQDMYPISFRVLTALVGEPGWPKLRENVNRDEEEAPVSADLAAQVRAANALDAALYEAIFPRWRAIRDALARHLA